MTDIVIQGIGGRMGHVLCDMIAQREDCRVIAGIDIKDGEQNGIPVYDSLEKLDGKGDVIIDFSSPAAVEKALPYCEAHKLPIVVCTTGLSEELQLKVVQLSRTVPVFKSANMSMGINVLSELCKRASAILGVNYDVEIVEQHHHNKLDAPSGTALMLADAINEQNNGEYHYVYDRSSVRQKLDGRNCKIKSDVRSHDHMLPSGKTSNRIKTCYPGGSISIFDGRKILPAEEVCAFLMACLAGEVHIFGTLCQEHLSFR